MCFYVPLKSARRRPEIFLNIAECGTIPGRRYSDGGGKYPRPAASLPSWRREQRN
jgi:hypothetical protein